MQAMCMAASSAAGVRSATRRVGCGAPVKMAVRTGEVKDSGGNGLGWDLRWEDEDEGEVGEGTKLRPELGKDPRLEDSGDGGPAEDDGPVALEFKIGAGLLATASLRTRAT